MDKRSIKLEQSSLSYNAEGFALVPQFISNSEVTELLKTVRDFHLKWCEENHEFYQSHAINSADLTGSTNLNNTQRLQLFKLIASQALNAYVSAIFGSSYGFMNTQLFFDPVQASRKNYWHRDPQWHLSLQQQQMSLANDQVIHCRIALIDEPGIEVIPKSHTQWDSKLELDTRLAQNGRKPHDDLPGSKVIQLKAGDMLIFSGNMIHRGLYGNNRMALDILFCEDKPDLLKWVNPDCLPNTSMLAKLDNPEIFTKSQGHAARKD